MYGMSNNQKGDECMKEEDSILKKAGKENAFKVPEGYFENLTSEVMNALPEKKPTLQVEQPTAWARMRPLLYMAAMFIGAFLIIRIGSWTQRTDTNVAEAGDTEMVTDEYIDVALDRSMMDDYSLYVYLSDAAAE